MKQMKLWMTMRLIVSIIVLAIFMSFCFVQEVAFLSILGSFCGILMWLLVIIYSYSSKQVKLILKEYELDIDSLIDNEIIRYQNYFVSDYFIIKKGFITMQVLYREDVSHAHYYENGVHVEAKIGKKMEIPLIDELFEKEVKYFLGSITNGIDAYCEDSHDALHEFYNYQEDLVEVEKKQVTKVKELETKQKNSFVSKQKAPKKKVSNTNNTIIILTSICIMIIGLASNIFTEEKEIRPEITVDREVNGCEHSDESYIANAYLYEVDETTKVYYNQLDKAVLIDFSYANGEYIESAFLYPYETYYLVELIENEVVDATVYESIYIDSIDSLRDVSIIFNGDYTVLFLHEDDACFEFNEVEDVIDEIINDLNTYLLYGEEYDICYPYDFGMIYILPSDIETLENESFDDYLYGEYEIYDGNISIAQY